MDASEKEEIPMLSSTRSQLPKEHMGVGPQMLTARTRSASMSYPTTSMDSDESEYNLVSHTGPLQSERRKPSIPMSGPIFVTRKPDNILWPMEGIKSHTSSTVMPEEYPSLETKNWPEPNDNAAGKNEHLLRSGPLGMCNDPFCTTCPTYYHRPPRQMNPKTSSPFDSKFHNILHRDAKGWMRRFSSFLSSYVPGIMNPHTKAVQQWNKFFVISCLVAIFVDPLFFFLLSAQQENRCIVLDWPMATIIAVVRSLTDFIYFLHILLQFRLAYVAPESRVVGAGELVDQPKKIALHYLYGYFLIDLFIVLPLPQIMILFVLPTYVGSSTANYAKNLLRATVLLQYMPRFFRFLPLLSGRSASGFIFETAWANFVINLLIFVLAGHVVGSCWYLFGLQRVNQCLRDACIETNMKDCKKFLDCGDGNNIEDYKASTDWNFWVNNSSSADCFTTSGSFNYGIYQQAVHITTVSSIITRYIYSLFWGFQQISTLAGNLVPSDFVWEVLFTMGIIGLGLFLFALLIGNMQNFLQALGRRRLEMQLRRRDVEQWMSHRRLPDDLRRLVRQSDRFNWAATRGVNEEELLENLPEDLQRDIRRHLFTFVKKVRIFSLMEEPILDSICERLRQKLYIKGSKILYSGGLVDKMVFIVRGKMESIEAYGNKSSLSEGDVCGEELLTWCLEHTSVNKDGRRIRIPGQLFSNRTVICLTNVEAFSLRAADLEEVTALFARFLRSPRVQGAIRYESPYWRGLAAMRIQVAWRYRKKRLSRDMRVEGLRPLDTTYSTLIGATGATANLLQGKQFHSLLMKTRSKLDIILENSLISMYAKCGEINDARYIFSNMIS